MDIFDIIETFKRMLEEVEQESPAGLSDWENCAKIAAILTLAWATSR